MTTLSFYAPGCIPEVRAGDSLALIIVNALAEERFEVCAGDILVVAQKIVSKAEGRTRCLRDVAPSRRAMDLARIVGKDPRYVEVVLQESRDVIRCSPGVLIVEDLRGFVVANAGIDASNVPSVDSEETILLLPAAPDESAARLREELMLALRQPVGVIINDSWGRAWRYGTVGTALGVAGAPALLDMRGMPDREGRTLRATEIGIADELAAGASALMGQASEGRPVVLVRGLAAAPRNGSGRELIRPRERDLFR